MENRECSTSGCSATFNGSSRRLYCDACRSSGKNKPSARSWCLECGVAVESQKSDFDRSWRRGRFCGYACKAKWSSRLFVERRAYTKMASRKPIVFRWCCVCGKSINEKASSATKCSDCSRYTHSFMVEQTRQCPCGETIVVPVGETSKRRLCGACKLERVRLQRRIYKRSRYAARRGAITEHFSPDEIFDRDGWECQACGLAVSKGHDVCHDLYPNLDHIIPLSKGGPHTRANTQCLCRKCNLEKSDTFTEADVMRVALAESGNTP